MKYCSQCGAANADQSKFCETCGSPLGESVPEVAPTQEMPPQQDPASVPYDAAPAAPEPPSAQAFGGYGAPVGAPMPSVPPVPAAPASNGKAIAALILGIAAIVLSSSIVLGIICGIVAIILAGSAAKQGRDGKATAGKVCGIIGLVLSIIMLVATVALGVMVASYTTDLDNMDAAQIAEITDNLESLDEDATVEEILDAIDVDEKDADADADAADDAAAASKEEPQKDKSDKKKSSAASKLVGLWDGSMEDGEPMKLEFLEDGTCNVIVNDLLADSGTYETEGDMLYIYGESATYDYEYAFKSGNLCLTYPGYDVTLVFERAA